ncbi:MAG: small conductance mechanosensitive channel [Solirubrobacteraceae bacterium]|jgi:small-conductance mechanosensitive channel|nr:small conductance mechanosensitive channel [Solirubrobacteraceae bacterium]
MREFFTTSRSTFRDAGIARELSRRAVKRARIQSLVLLPVLAGVLVTYNHRAEIFGRAYDVPVRIVTFVALLSLSWQFARDAGRALGPTFFRRMDPATAGTVGFLVRLVTMLAAGLIALRIAGLGPGTLALGGAFSAVVVGLAAQQTLGNVFAGMVLLSARPFRVGERVRMQGGGLAGTVEGVVSSLGLLYTTLARGDDSIMVPNSVVLNVAVVPLREPEGVELRARLRPGVTPLDVQEMLHDAIQTPMRGSPRITLEEVDGDEVVVHITAVPEHPADGPRLAGELLDAVASQTARPVA